MANTTFRTLQQVQKPVTISHEPAPRAQEREELVCIWRFSYEIE